MESGNSDHPLKVAGLIIVIPILVDWLFEKMVLRLLRTSYCLKTSLMLRKNVKILEQGVVESPVGDGTISITGNQCGNSDKALSLHSVPIMNSHTSNQIVSANTMSVSS